MCEAMVLSCRHCVSVSWELTGLTALLQACPGSDPLDPSVCYFHSSTRHSDLPASASSVPAALPSQPPRRCYQSCAEWLGYISLAPMCVTQFAAYF